jgi:hypothetical protein
MQKPLHVESGNAHLSHSHIVELLGVRAYVIGISPFNSCLGQIMVPSARRSVRGIVIQNINFMSYNRAFVSWLESA